MKPIVVIAATAAISTLALAGAGLAAGLVNVEQKNIAFSTPSLTVAKGSIVNFLNSDTTSHNIIISGEGLSMNSGLQQPGVAFKAPMMKAGEYQVTCAIHPKMKMTMIVQ